MSKKCFEKRKRGDSLTSKSPHPPHLFHGVSHRADGFRLPLMCPATMYCELCKCTHSLHVPEDLFKILLLFQGGSWQSERSSTSPKAREVSAYPCPQTSISATGQRAPGVPRWLRRHRQHAQLTVMAHRGDLAYGNRPLGHPLRR